MRDREQEAEEDRDARPLEVVGDDDADREAVDARRSSPAFSRVAPVDCTIARCPTAPVTPDDVRRAADVIEGAVHRTPTFSSRSLGPGQYLKAELFQRTGSFKARGALNRVRSLSRRRARRAA